MYKVTVPRHHVNDDSAILLSWYIKDGSRVNKGDKIAELESTKASYDIESPEAGIVSYNLKEKSELAIGSLLCVIAEEHLDSAATQIVPTKTIDITLKSDATSKVSNTRFSPKAKALIEKYGLDASTFKGRGLIKSSDVEEILAKINQSKNHITSSVPVHKLEISRAKKFEIKNLSESSRAIIPSSVSTSCNTVGFRYLTTLKGSPASATAIIIFEVSRLLKKYPLLNGFYMDEHFHLYDQVNIGFAMDAGKGLKVPVIKAADEKSIQSLQAELDDLVLHYLEDRLEPRQLSDSTFTITDLSAGAVFTFAPVINFKQSAILGIGSENIPGNGLLGTYQLILGFDHKLTSGKETAAFLYDLKTRLEGYEAMLLSMHSDSFFNCAQCLRPISELNANGAHLLQIVQATGTIKQLCSFCLGGW